MANPTRRPSPNSNPVDAPTRRLPSGWLRIAPILGLVVLTLMTLWSPRSEARLDPYYLLRGLSTGSVKPRILFVLDTSGSMTWRTDNSNNCPSGSCENTASAGRSRINAAREGIRTVISNVGDTANFGLMTFGQNTPPKYNSQVPGTCGTICTNQVYYCRDSGSWGSCGSTKSCPVPWTGGGWSSSLSCPSTGQSCDGCDTWSSCSASSPVRFDNESQMDFESTSRYYEICGTNRPFPYLRWDDLGSDSVITADDRTGAVPPSPLISVTTSNSTKITQNRTRKVQWFPEFMGVRVNLNNTTDPGKQILVKTFGDYGNPNNGGDSNTSNDSVSSAQNSGVWGRDFYYWPYVDGFIGYGHWYDYAYCDSWGCSVGDQIGHNSDQSNATLYAPFYLEGATSLPAASRGPDSLDDARQQVFWLTSDQKDGGVDAAGGTPWTDAIGAIPPGTTNDNSAFSHSTVASYLKFATTALNSDACLPTAAILVTDGDPNCAQNGGNADTCGTLYNRIRALRNSLNVDVYVVGFLISGTPLQRMACAGAGAGSNGDTNPCNDTPADNWDTCRVVETDGHQDNCAYLATNSTQLAQELTQIVTSVVELDLDAGPGTSATESGVGANGAAGQGVVVNTAITARTEYPEWRGHVTREPCEDTSQVYCQTQPFDNVEYTFQPSGVTACPQSRDWDAADCLQARPWHTRNIYFNNSSNAVFPIWSGGAGGAATAQFRAALNDPSNGVPGAGSFSTTDATNIARFLLGQNWPGGYKLAGLANSAPTVVRRIPKVQSDFQPSVGIRDPHCAGRLLDFNQEVDSELVDFARDAWSASGLISTTPTHYEYQEAVVIGSDIGLIHFFQFNSGNEIFAFLPRFHLPTVYEQYLNGTANMGQPTDLANHSFGMAATANNAWVYDDVASKWRHVMVMGSGIGSKHYIAFDVSHLTPFSSSGPIEVLWSTQDSRSNSAWTNMQNQLGESWARPAISFHNADQVADQVEGVVVLSSGYPVSGGGALSGRYMAVLDVITGDVLDNFSVPAPTASTFDSVYGQISDPAVASYCESGYWGDAQETYINDPAGRLFRVDLADGLSHARDWGNTPSGPNRELNDVYRFPACEATTRPCSISGSNKGDVFVFSPAVAALGRIDEAPGDPIEKDQILIAMASGSVYDDATDGGDATNTFHSSLYLVRDDHSSAASGGISIPASGNRTAPGSNAGFMRVVLSDLQRTRVFTPYPGASEITETAYFHKGTRPVGSPLIRVTRGLEADTSAGASPGDVVEIPGVEFYFIEYTVYEPPTESCDTRFRDTANGIWYADQGSTYTLTFRLPVDPTAGFDFVNGAGTAYGGGGFSNAGLEMAAVQQVTGGDCADGVCGAARGTPSVAPCDPNNNPATSSGTSARGVGYSEVRGFSPFER